METNEIIRKRRKELGLTLKQVADELGVSESLISRYESNDVKNMGIDKITPLSKILKCSPAYLMGWEEPEKDPIIEEYQLDEYELAEYNKILNMNMLMFNGKELSEEGKEKLEIALKEVFVEELLKKRAAKKK